MPQAANSKQLGGTLNVSNSGSPKLTSKRFISIGNLRDFRTSNTLDPHTRPFFTSSTSFFYRCINPISEKIPSSFPISWSKIHRRWPNPTRSCWKAPGLRLRSPPQKEDDNDDRTVRFQAWYLFVGCFVCLFFVSNSHTMWDLWISRNISWNPKHMVFQNII